MVFYYLFQSIIYITSEIVFNISSRWIFHEVCWPRGLRFSVHFALLSVPEERRALAPFVRAAQEEAAANVVSVRTFVVMPN